MRCLSVALGLLAAWMLAGALACPAVEEKAQSAETTVQKEKASKPAPEEGFQKAPKKHLEEIQGLWVRTEKVRVFSSRRITKEIKGDAETVTYYDTSGNVERAHTVKVKLAVAGPIRVFAFSDFKATEGPNKGQTSEGTQAYIYKVVGDTFIEIWGVLGDSDSQIRTMRWKRQKPSQ